MRVTVADPAAFTPPYDHALCAALARAGADVELVTTRFAHGDVPAADGYARVEAFYPRSTTRPRARRAARLAQHVPGMLALRRRPADVLHVQWLPVQPVDERLLPRDKPIVLTAHDILPREPRPGQVRATRRLLERVDAVVVHSEHGRDRLRGLGVDATVIPHGAFAHLRDVGGTLPAELAGAPDGPVALFFGLLRPYKGLDVLLEAWREVEHGELWIVGLPRMPLPGVLPPRVRLVGRFVSDAEAVGLFARASLAVLPYRESEGSGVLATAQALGTPLVLSDAGPFAEEPDAVHVPAGDAPALARALAMGLADPDALPRSHGASWDEIAGAHLRLYGTLTR